MKNRKCVFGGLLDSCFLKQPVGMSPSVDDVEHVTDVDTDAAYTGDTQVIITDAETGITYFAESAYRSAPYFDVRIDGITLLNEAYQD